jgi:pilus assembly protein CpaF
MKLSERLKSPPRPPTIPGVPAGAPGAAASAAGAEISHTVFNTLKAAVHAKVIDRVDFRALDGLGDRASEELRALINATVASEQLPLNRIEQDRLVQEVLDEILGLGPLEPLLKDQAVSDILINGHKTVYVERKGKLELSNIQFRDDEHLLHIIQRIVNRVGRRVDESSPMVDARLPDGSRVNAIIPPLAIDGPAMSIRRFGGTPLKMTDLVNYNALLPEMAEFLRAAVKARLNVIISGGTGTGKTTMLNSLSSFIPGHERILTIEDAAELQLQQPHVVRLETRPSNIEGKGEVTQRELVKNALRMRPDRVILGEVRGPEVLDMLQAMNTGHEGSMATVHANTPRDCLMRLVSMIGMGGGTMSETVMMQMISRAIDLIVQLTRGSDGKRRMVAISEVTGMEGSVITLQDLFVFQQRGVDAQGKIVGEFRGMAVRPRCFERLERAGTGVDAAIFTARKQA